MSKQELRWIQVSGPLGIFIFIWIIRLMADCDYRLVASGGKPRFTFSGVPFADGGSIMYSGIGYRVTAVHRIVPFFHPTGEETGTLFRVGPELQYWIPGFGRDGTSTNFILYPQL